MVTATCIAATLEKRRPLPVDALVPEPIFTSTHAITIDAPPERVWPWIAQMGAGRAGWYSWDAIDNGRHGLAAKSGWRPECLDMKQQGKRRCSVIAPSKTLVWFEESGYQPFVDEPAKFNAAMVNVVRPLSGAPQ